MLLTIWEIWRERNKRVFKRDCNSVQQIMETIYEEAKAWVYAGNKAMQHVLPRLVDPNNPDQETNVIANVAPPVYVI